MPRYLISFDAHAMDHIPDEDMPAVTNASLAVVEEAINAGAWVFGGGLEHQMASIVATDGTVTDGPYPEAIGGLCVVDVPSREEALQWAAKTAVACRCAQEVREFMPIHRRQAGDIAWPACGNVFKLDERARPRTGGTHRVDVEHVDRGENR